MIKTARTKGCAWPVATAIDYAANRAYKIGDLIKVGSYVTTGRWGDGYLMWLTLFMKYGSTQQKTDLTTITAIDFTVGALSDPSVTGTTINMRTGGLTPSTPAAFVAYMAAVTDATAGFNLSKMGFIFTQQWAGGGPFPSSAGFSGTWEGSDAYYTCSRPIAASSYAPDGYYSPSDILPTNGEPWHRDYWFPMPSTYSPSTSQGAARTDCNGENAYEAKFCGRCGRPV